jgi:hypothetical protein
MFKYTNDTNLLVPEHTNLQLQAGFDTVQSWAARNKMIINFTKTEERFSIDLIHEWSLT